jgi:uncharacterized membrane protein YhiD involved in acid resistance
VIAQTLTTLTNEIAGLWSWVVGIIAGWGLTVTAVVAVVIYAHIRINRLKYRVERLNNQLVSETRDLSIRLRTLEKN